MKIFNVNVTIVITLFGAKFHGRILRSFTKTKGNQGMTVNILMIQDEQIPCDREETFLCHINTIRRQCWKATIRNIMKIWSVMHRSPDLGTQFYTPAWNVFMKTLLKKKRRQKKEKKKVYSCVWKFMDLKKKRKKRKKLYSKSFCCFHFGCLLFFFNFVFELAVSVEVLVNILEHPSFLFFFFPITTCVLLFFFTQWPKCEHNPILKELHFWGVCRSSHTQCCFVRRFVSTLETLHVQDELYSIFSDTSPVCKVRTDWISSPALILLCLPYFFRCGLFLSCNLGTAWAYSVTSNVLFRNKKRQWFFFFCITISWICL